MRLHCYRAVHSGMDSTIFYFSQDLNLHSSTLQKLITCHQKFYLLGNITIQFLILYYYYYDSDFILKKSAIHVESLKGHLWGILQKTSGLNSLYLLSCYFHLRRNISVIRRNCRRSGRRPRRRFQKVKTTKSSQGYASSYTNYNSV